MQRRVSLPKGEITASASSGSGFSCSLAGTDLPPSHRDGGILG
ncbi:hypothetical protein PL263_00410 [Methylomonas sp. EFPC3]|nr:hypothetical protein [Methylomonas sp. EFPC3]WFP50503.1 hypothetical protein PL263_00410 [Methylomonas sp. EFPC3]